MSNEGNRYMWLFVFFDLPVKKKIERKRASSFRRFLLKDGYTMLQFSIYTRICNGEEAIEKHTKRLQNELPPEGHIRSMQITDLQYERIKLLVYQGEKLKKKSKKKGANDTRQLSFF